MHSLCDEAVGRTAKERRRIAKYAATVERWWATLSESEKARPFYRSAELIRGTGLESNQLGPALRSLGWRYAQRRLPELMNTPFAVWAPPWQPDPRRAPGRPSSTRSTTQESA
jgi:hypothetical protein